jgi:uncharacterized membrane protein YhhN
MKTLRIAIMYILAGVLFLLFENGNYVLPVFILKALIIPVLIVLFLVNIRPAGNRFHIFMLAGLIFSWAGDVLLEVPMNIGDMFIPGLICFLLAHVMYLVVFYSTSGRNLIAGKRSFLLIPVIVYGAVLIFYLYNGLGDMRIPVILYAIVILAMLTGAINRLEKVNRISFRTVLAGAMLFVLSDSAIAVNKFHHHFEGSSVIIMSTYILAQLLIVTGYIRQYQEKFE